MTTGALSLVSLRPWPIEYTSTQRVTAEDTTSISAASWSATSTMPTGGGQPPTASTTGPYRYACTSSTTATVNVTVRQSTLTVRCTRGRSASSRVSAAPSSGTTTGRGRSRL